MVRKSHAWTPFFLPSQLRRKGLQVVESGGTNLTWILTIVFCVVAIKTVLFQREIRVPTVQIKRSSFHLVTSEWTKMNEIWMNGLINMLFTLYWACLVAQSVKNLPAMQETQGWCLCWEEPLDDQSFQYSSLENPMDRKTCSTAVHEVAKSWTWLSDWHFLLFTSFCIN